ncbi:hypothetical protein K3495_g5335 [Podosphaera aphanis]|nr:hypothetical protein K3495_g5335 [Podosphaera aphanis]
MTENADGQTPTAFSGPSDKEKKYDRQLRLWAAQGQQALEDAEILLINTGSGTVGVETLKNLILPGIGKFTIVDNAKVTDADLGVNFFLDEDSLGSSRATACVRLLQELNPDVKGVSHSELHTTSLERLFKKQKFTFIINTYPIKREILDVIQQHATRNKIPMISVHSAGFYSYFKIYYPTIFPIVHTHPDPEAVTDLRLLNPWEELSRFSSELTKNIESLSAQEHGHIPYVAILLHFLAEWKTTHGSYPSTYSEKMAFKKIIAQNARTNTAEGSEENFDEAIAAVMKNIRAPSLSSSIKEVFDYSPAEHETNASFWIISNAVKDFYKKHHELPLPGSVPDMKAESNTYVKLQNIYKAKARNDVAEVFETVQKHPNGKSVDISAVESFCKNAAFIKLINTKEENFLDINTIAKREFDNDDMSAVTLQPLSLLPIYLALEATSHESKVNCNEILTKIEKNIPGASSNNRIQQISQEVARAKGAELHNTSALAGGIVAQEVIKIITEQYVPVDNLCIFDGISSRVQVLKI